MKNNSIKRAVAHATRSMMGCGADYLWENTSGNLASLTNKAIDAATDSLTTTRGWQRIGSSIERSPAQVTDDSTHEALRDLIPRWP